MKIEPKKIVTRADTKSLLVRVSPEAKKELVRLAKENGVSIIHLVDCIIGVK